MPYCVNLELVIKPSNFHGFVFDNNGPLQTVGNVSGEIWLSEVSDKFSLLM